MKAEELTRSQGVIQKFLGRYDTYRDMMKRAERQEGNLCLCFVKKHRGYCQYIYDGKHWLLLQEPVMEQRSLAGEGKCLVTGKLRVMGKGWVLTIDGKPDGLAIGRKMKCSYKDMIYTVTGFGGLRHMTHLELILSPNDVVGTGIEPGDVLQLLDE